LVVAVEDDLSIVQLRHNEGEAVVVTVLVMLDELSVNHQPQLVVDKIVNALLHDDLDLSIFEHYADVEATRAIHRSEDLDDGVLKDEMVVFFPLELLDVEK
jgi:hypothetical protein